MVVTIFLFMGFGALAHAFGRGHFGDDFSGIGPRALKCLDLTADQKKQIAGIQKKYQPQMDQSLAEIRKLREQELDPGSGVAFNEEEARYRFREAMPKFEDMFILKAKIRNEIRSVLTEDQIGQLKEKRARWAEKSKDRMKHRQAMMGKWLETDEQ